MTQRFSGSAHFQFPQLVRVHDVDELNHAVSGSDLEVFRLKADTLEAKVGHVSLGDFSLDQAMINVPVRARGDLDRHRYSLLAFHAKARGTWNGYPVDPSRLLYFMPGRELDGHTAGNYGCVSIVMPPDWIESIASTTGRTDLLQMPRDCRTIRPAMSKITEVWQAAVAVVSAASGDTAGSETVEWCASNLRNALGAALTADNEPDGKPLAHTLAHFSVARRAERLFRERMAEPLCIDDVCLALRVSRRYLEYAFADAFGASPSRYLRLLRLHEVRRRLKRPCSTTTVTREALALGFNHLSLFSGQYKKTFGESPSQTLKGEPLRV